MIVLAGPMAGQQMKAPSYSISSVPKFERPENFLRELGMKAAESSIDELVKDEDIGAKVVKDKLKEKAIEEYYKYRPEMGRSISGMVDNSNYAYYNRGMMPEEDDSIVKLAGNELEKPMLDAPDYGDIDVPEVDRGMSNTDVALKILTAFANEGGITPKYAQKGMHGTMTEEEKARENMASKYFGAQNFMFPMTAAGDLAYSYLFNKPSPFKSRKDRAKEEMPVEVIEAPSPEALRMMMDKEEIMPDNIINPRDVPMVEGEFYYGPMANNYNKGKEKVKPKDGITLAQTSGNIGPGDPYFEKHNLNPQMYRDYYDNVDEFSRFYRIGPMAKSGSMPIQKNVSDDFYFMLPSETNEGSLKSGKSNAYDYVGFPYGRMKVVNPIPQKVYNSWMGKDEPLKDIKVLEANKGMMPTYAEAGMMPAMEAAAAKLGMTVKEYMDMLYHEQMIKDYPSKFDQLEGSGSTLNKGGLANYNEGMMPDVPKSRPNYLKYLYSSNIDLPESRPVPTTFMNELEEQKRIFDYPIYSTPAMGLTAFMNMYKKNKKLKEAKAALKE